MKTLIIGGGLSGLAVAERLQDQGHDYMLLEARSRFGGRIMTHRFDDGYFDMGPAWFWPGQPRIAALIDRLELIKFDQFSDGALLFENERGQVQRVNAMSPMQGSWRLEGGLARLTDALADRLPDDRKRLNAAVTKMDLSGGRCVAILSTGEHVTADRVVLALPPRLVADIAFSPRMPAEVTSAMQGIATWMAGQAKAVAVYDTPFWRARGLSGDAMSRSGPLVEIHDASPRKGGPYALFGFIGVPPDARENEQSLRRKIRHQLERLFGPDAAEPRKLYIKDWARDPRTATDADKMPLSDHPTYGLPPAMTNLWNGKLLFAGTEVAATFGGYIEGALEAADDVLRILCPQDVVTGRGQALHEPAN